MLARFIFSLALFAVCVLAAQAAPAQAQADISHEEINLGDVITVAFPFCPLGMIQARGQLLSVSDNRALFTLYGTSYGGDGRRTFGVPNLAGRTPIHAGAYGRGPDGRTYTAGQSGGRRDLALDQNSLPRHNHPLHASSNAPTSWTPSGRMFATFSSGPMRYNSGGPSDLAMIGGYSGTVDHAPEQGLSMPFGNMNPHLVLNYCVVVSDYPAPVRHNR